MDSSYGDRIADWYDQQHGQLEPAAVALLAELAAPGNRALELGVGTGRVALPLAGRGIAVTGIDCSQQMLARLAAKPGADRVRTIVCDMSDVPVDGEFDLVYVVANTFFGILTQEAQIACLARCAARLAPGGTMLIEAFVPDLTRFGQPVHIVPIKLRYANVPELDLMARVAGLTLHARWAGWNKEPFGSGAGTHVSVYTRREPRP